MAFIYLIVLYIADTYNYFKDFRQVINIVYVFITCWVGTFVVVLVFYFPLKGWIIGRLFWLSRRFPSLLLVSVWRFTFSVIALPQRLEKRIIIIGAGKSGRYLLNAVARETGMRFPARGFCG